MADKKKPFDRGLAEAFIQAGEHQDPQEKATRMAVLLRTRGKELAAMGIPVEKLQVKVKARLQQRTQQPAHTAAGFSPEGNRIVNDEVGVLSMAQLGSLAERFQKQYAEGKDILGGEWNDLASQVAPYPSERTQGRETEPRQVLQREVLEDAQRAPEGLTGRQAAMAGGLARQTFAGGRALAEFLAGIPEFMAEAPMKIPYNLAGGATGAVSSEEVEDSLHGLNPMKGAVEKVTEAARRSAAREGGARGTLEELGGLMVENPRESVGAAGMAVLTPGLVRSPVERAGKYLRGRGAPEAPAGEGTPTPPPPANAAAAEQAKAAMLQEIQKGVRAGTITAEQAAVLRADVIRGKAPAAPAPAAPAAAAAAPAKGPAIAARKPAIAPPAVDMKSPSLERARAFFLNKLEVVGRSELDKTLVKTLRDRVMNAKTTAEMLAAADGFTPLLRGQPRAEGSFSGIDNPFNERPGPEGDFTPAGAGWTESIKRRAELDQESADEIPSSPLGRKETPWDREYRERKDAPQLAEARRREALNAEREASQRAEAQWQQGYQRAETQRAGTARRAQDAQARRRSEMNLAYEQDAALRREESRKETVESERPAFGGEDAPTSEPIRPPEAIAKDRLETVMEAHHAVELPIEVAKARVIDALKAFPAKQTRSARRLIRKLKESPGWQEKLKALARVSSKPALAAIAAGGAAALLANADPDDVNTSMAGIGIFGLLGGKRMREAAAELAKNARDPGTYFRAADLESAARVSDRPSVSRADRPARVEALRNEVDSFYPKTVIDPKVTLEGVAENIRAVGVDPQNVEFMNEGGYNRLFLEMGENASRMVRTLHTALFGSRERGAQLKQWFKDAGPASWDIVKKLTEGRAAELRADEAAVYAEHAPFFDEAVESWETYREAVEHLAEGVREDYYPHALGGWLNLASAREHRGNGSRRAGELLKKRITTIDPLRNPIEQMMAHTEAAVNVNVRNPVLEQLTSVKKIYESEGRGTEAGVVNAYVKSHIMNEPSTIDALFSQAALREATTYRPANGETFPTSGRMGLPEGTVEVEGRTGAHSKGRDSDLYSVKVNGSAWPVDFTAPELGLLRLEAKNPGALNARPVSRGVRLLGRMAGLKVIAANLKVLETQLMSNIPRTLAGAPKYKELAKSFPDVLRGVYDYMRGNKNALAEEAEVMGVLRENIHRTVDETRDAAGRTEAAVFESTPVKLLYAPLVLFEATNSLLAYAASKRAFARISAEQGLGWSEARIRQEAALEAYRITDAMVPTQVPSWSSSPLYQATTFLMKSEIKEISQFSKLVTTALRKKGSARSEATKNLMSYMIVKMAIPAGIVAGLGLTKDDGLELFLKTFPVMSWWTPTIMESVMEGSPSGEKDKRHPSFMTQGEAHVPFRAAEIMMNWGSDVRALKEKYRKGKPRTGQDYAKIAPVGQPAWQVVQALTALYNDPGGSSSIDQMRRYRNRRTLALPTRQASR